MAAGSSRTAQQRDARELALTSQPDPYRGSLRDPFADLPAEAPARPVEAVPPLPRSGGRGTPGPATVAGTIGIVLGLCQALFGTSLLLLVSLQNEYGAPDRSFYSGSDSGYVILGLVDFGLAIGCLVGGIRLMNGRVAGRVAVTATGWGTLGLSAFWYLRGHVVVAVPVLVAVAAAVMLACAYQRSVTYWLGVLPPPQPE
ncbi:MAG: hypothetical protein ABI140_16345 [Jatrophihabitantaceae bacterium]